MFEAYVIASSLEAGGNRTTGAQGTCPSVLWWFAWSATTAPVVVTPFRNGVGDPGARDAVQLHHAAVAVPDAAVGVERGGRREREQPPAQRVAGMARQAEQRDPARPQHPQELAQVGPGVARLDMLQDDQRKDEV